MSKNKMPPADNEKGGDTSSAGEGGLVLWQELLRQFSRIVSEIDAEAAAAHVLALRAKYPEEDGDAIVERLIRDKCLKTGTIGAVTSGAAIIPGIGTVASLTVGVAADMRETFRHQAELIVEIAAAREHPLTADEKHAAVLLITGMGSGANQAIKQVGKQTTIKVTERYAQKWVAHALPVVGVAVSTATNALTTYLVGRRADAYFRLGPEAAGDWGEIWRAVTGVNEREVGAWFAAQASNSWHRVQSGASSAASTLAGAKKATTEALASGASSAARIGRATGEAISSASSTVASTAMGGVSAATSRATDTAAATGQVIGNAAKAAGGAVKSKVADTRHKVGTLLKRKKKDQPAHQAGAETSDSADAG